MIENFKCKETKKIFHRIYSKKFSKQLQRKAYIKLLLINAAINVQDLMVPPGNKLEKLSGNRKGQYSIRINNQWRICFNWIHGNAQNVEITDYHT